MNRSQWMGVAGVVVTGCALPPYEVGPSGTGASTGALGGTEGADDTTGAESVDETGGTESDDGGAPGDGVRPTGGAGTGGARTGGGGATTGGDTTGGGGTTSTSASSMVENFFISACWIAWADMAGSLARSSNGFSVTNTAP
ncbi:MAG TPA: hypothetical protein PLU22_23655, partial [Polyangiaceae bacterium]|nr:hypothetical protein [Polyangiaceae bacterium]